MEASLQGGLRLGLCVAYRVAFLDKQLYSTLSLSTQVYYGYMANC